MICVQHYLGIRKIYLSPHWYLPDVLGQLEGANLGKETVDFKSPVRGGQVLITHLALSSYFHHNSLSTLKAKQSVDVK